MTDKAVECSPEELEKAIRFHRQKYYNGEPIISDADFDNLVEALRLLKPDSGDAGKRQHTIPMGSLDKIKEEDFLKWAESLGCALIAQEKYDGISIALEYDRGQLIAAITRGDGFIGEVVTHNAIWQNVKLTLPEQFTGTLRGEIVLNKSDFARYFSDAGFANPRNTVSGLVRRKTEGELNGHFRVKYFDVVDHLNHECFPTETEKMQFLYYTLDLETAFTEYNLTPDQALTVFQDYTAKRETLDYEIDGLVIKADDCQIQKRLGSTNNRPKWAAALKFKSQGAWTTLRDVDWQLGVGGRLTPVARLQPVEVAGVMIQNATLHHHEYIKSLGGYLQPGDDVFVKRAGDVIPQITERRSTPQSYRGVLQPPKVCPVCNSPTSIDGKFIICQNEWCAGKTYGGIYRWVKEVEIDGLAQSWIETFIEAELVKQPADLYRLTVEQLATLDRMGVTLATKFVSMIQSRRTPPLVHYIAGLNIQQFSRSRVQTLIDAGFTTLQSFIEATVEQLQNVSGIGPQLAEVIVAGMKEKLPVISALAAANVVPTDGTVKLAEGILVGKSFCFTGAVKRINTATTKKWTRAQMQGLVKQNGGDVKSNVSNGLTYLVIADPDSTSAKAKKARSLGITLLSEDEFFEMVSVE
jgi:DNA ligase (NAD+)